MSVNDMKKAAKKMTDELRQLAELPEAQINTDDMPEVTDWSDAERGRFFRPIKKQVTLRLDADLLAWFQAQGKGYQTRINAALREFVEEHRKAV
ncbi:MAG: BrnA antitoxin family protein [Candidatus Sedimenticola sp. 6PFRAG5]